MKGIWESWRDRKGFTLVELLVVIAIIGVLATLVLLQLGTARGRARDTQRITHVNQLRTAVEQYYEDHEGSYPDDLEADNLGQYIAKVPVDPLSGKGYGYAVVNDGTSNTSFVIWAGLEQNAAALKSDADLIGPGADEDPGWVTKSQGAVDPGSGTDDAEACNTTPSPEVCIYDQGVMQ